MIDPARSLPRAIHAAMVVVIISFQLTLFSYYVLLPWKLLDTGDSVAVVGPGLLVVINDRSGSFTHDPHRQQRDHYLGYQEATC